MVLNLLKSIANELMPKNCRCCGALLLDNLDSNYYQLCPTCFEPYCASPFEEAAIQKSLCLRCGEIIDADMLQQSICVNCTLSPLPLRFVRSLFFYNEHTNGLLKKLKYCCHYSLSSTVGELMASKVKLLFSNTDWDLILPIPSDPSIMADRGYHHTGLVTKLFSKKIIVKSSMSTLKSIKFRKPQASLGLKQRIKNMQNVFAVKKHNVSNLRILLIDDTITSGATVISAARSLLSNGAKSVDAFSLLRSEHFAISRPKVFNL